MYFRRLSLIALLSVIVFAMYPMFSHAQSDKPCDTETTIKKAAALQSTGDKKKDLEAINSLIVDIHKLNAECATTEENDKIKLSVLTEKDYGTKEKPVPVGSAIKIERDKQTYLMGVKEIKIGDEAEKLMKYSKPDEGNTYVAAKFVVSYLEGPKDKVLDFSDVYFEILTMQQLIDKDEYFEDGLRVKYFPGATGEGWVIKQIFKDDPDPLLVFQQYIDGGIYFATK